MKTEKISIKWKLIGYMVSFTGAILVLLWLFQVAFLDVFYRNIRVSEMKEAAKTISQNFDNDIFNDSISSFAFEKGMCVDIIDEDGKVVYSVDSVPSCAIHKYTQQEKTAVFERLEENGGTDILEEEVRRPANPFDIPEGINNISEKAEPQEQGNNQSAQQYSGRNFRGELLRGHAVEDGYFQIRNLIYSQLAVMDGKTVAIMLNTALTPLGATREILKTEILYITAILLVFSVILSYGIYRKISRPIIETNNSAKELARANYNASFKQGGYKEIAQLNETLSFAARELGKTEALQRELLSNISHDLRTPLTLITGYAEVMRDIPGENTPENVQVIIDESNRLSNLVTDILDISKLQASVSEVSLERISITESIHSVLCRYSKLTGQEGYIIEFEKKEEAFVMADEVKLLQVIYNLINNAVNYTGSDKRVIIKQTVLEGKVKIDIIDTGEGIEPKDLPYIWDRYYKSSKVHNRGTVGTGLGLSIAKNVLELHKAEYGVSNVVGKGSDFWFIMDTIS